MNQLCISTDQLKFECQSESDKQDTWTELTILCYEHTARAIFLFTLAQYIGKPKIFCSTTKHDLIGAKNC